ncbi:hypothetical protein AB2T90_11100 [Clostridium butyricum]|uniref:hypothetical protein n=1 Tax=Clostridium butyricum TaxID=1492 RepID=UPI00346578AD
MNDIVTTLVNEIVNVDKNKILIWNGLISDKMDLDILYVMTFDLNKDIQVVSMQEIVRNLYNENVYIIK